MYLESMINTYNSQSILKCETIPSHGHTHTVTSTYRTKKMKIRVDATNIYFDAHTHKDACKMPVNL